MLDETIVDDILMRYKLLKLVSPDANRVRSEEEDSELEEE